MHFCLDQKVGELHAVHLHFCHYVDVVVSSIAVVRGANINIIVRARTFLARSAQLAAQQQYSVYYLSISRSSQKVNGVESCLYFPPHYHPFVGAVCYDADSIIVVRTETTAKSYVQCQFLL